MALPRRSKTSQAVEEEYSQQDSNLQPNQDQEELQELNPEDYEVPIELSTRNKYAGKPKVRANKSRPLVGSHGPKVHTPTFGVVRGVYN